MDSMERQQFLEEQDEMQRDVIKAYLTRERDTWMGHCVRVERSGGYDGAALLDKNNSMDQINGMLEELFDVGKRD